MASKVYNEEVIALQDDTEVNLRPMPIARLRRFQDSWSKFSEAKTEDEALSVLVNCAGISLEDNFRGDKRFEDGLKASAAAIKKGEYLSVKYREYLEDVLDIDTIYKVLEVCGGLKLNDPKLLEAAAQVAKNL